MASNIDYLPLIQAKGTYCILHALRFIPKRYNDLKDQLGEQISSRTLDNRLKDLKLMKLIRQKTYEINGDLISQYYLTQSGKTLESVLHNLHHPSQSLTPKTFSNNYRTHVKKTYNYNWKTVWPILKQICLTKLQIQTLATNRINIIDSVKEDGIVVHTDKGEALIETKLIQQAWENLVVDGKLYLNEHEKSTYRSSFICSLLSHLDMVEVHDKRPIYIFLS